jgi:hypothetical protein
MDGIDINGGKASISVLRYILAPGTCAYKEIEMVSETLSAWTLQPVRSDHPIVSY